MSRTRNDFRQSQLVVPFGPGALIDRGGESFMVCSADQWRNTSSEPPELKLGFDERKIFEPRLALRLGGAVKYFLPPPDSQLLPEGVPAVRFPDWLWCPNCKRLKGYRTWKREWVKKVSPLNGKADDVTRLKARFDVPECYECFHPGKGPLSKSRKYRLLPAPFLICCTAGHIDDFPWSEWCHAGGEATDKKTKCSAPNLRLEMGDGLSARTTRVECTTCGAKNNLARIFDKESLGKVGVCCSGLRPWDKWKKEPCCKAKTIVVHRGGTNLYYAVKVSSITIPPISDSIAARIRRTPEYNLIQKDFNSAAHSDDLSAHVTGLDFLKTQVNDQRATLAQILNDRQRDLTSLARELNIDLDYLQKLITICLVPDAQDAADDEVSYRFAEHRALISKCGDDEKADLRVSPLQDLGILAPFFDRINLVERMREVTVLRHFSRVEPNGQVGYQTVASPECPWLPGAEGRGEGIFLSLNKERLAAWLSAPEVRQWTEDLNRSLAKGRFQVGPILPEKVLIHTFSHLLIRELSLESGYSIASMKERIYVADPGSSQEHKEMRGVLIYIASTDRHGTLGGLVRSGSLENLQRIIRKAIEKATWCSADPVCMETESYASKGNHAACFACTHLPETACECFNGLLDRRFVIGVPDREELGFFGPLIKEE